jgi:hypothetical protein
MSRRNAQSVAALLIVCLVTTMFVACQRAVVHGEIRDQHRARTLERLKKEIEVEKRLRKIKGATAAEVSTELAASARKSPCGTNDGQCSFYDVDGVSVFVCFDQTGKVTCNGTVSLIH